MVLHLPERIPAASSAAHASVVAASRELGLEACTAADLKAVNILYSDLLAEVQVRGQSTVLTKAG